MRVSVASKGNQISEGVREYLIHRANLALGRYRLRIHSLKVTLEDISNPSTGTAQSCRVELDADFGKRFIVVHDRSFKSAIDCALGVCNGVVESAVNQADSEMFVIASQHKMAS